MRQLLLLPDPRPLDERLGRDFFRNAPNSPGVYLMRDAADKVLYVGKARNLRQRLRNYRIANPDRMLRRHLRMLREVAGIDFEICASEADALAREASLLLSLRPKYNRAGVWTRAPRFFLWRLLEEKVELSVAEAPQHGWQQSGPLRGDAARLQRTLARLLWLAVNSTRPTSEFPAGWFRRAVPDTVAIHCGSIAEEAGSAVTAFFSPSPGDFAAWVEPFLVARTHPFDRAVIAAELENLEDFSAHRKQVVAS